MDAFAIGYLFNPSIPTAPVIAVRGLLGITTTYFGSNADLVDTMAKVVCRQCFDEWIAIHPWNDTPPTLKVPPTCSHLTTEVTDDTS